MDDCCAATPQNPDVACAMLARSHPRPRSSCGDLLGRGGLGLGLDGLVELALLGHGVELGLYLFNLLLLLLGQAVEQRLLLAVLQVVVEGADDRVGVVNGELAHVGHGLDLCGALLVLRVGHLDAELVAARLDGVPAGQARGEVDVARHAKVGRVDDFVGRWIAQDGLCVDAGLWVGLDLWA